MFQMDKLAIAKLPCPVGHVLGHDVCVDVYFQKLEVLGNTDCYDYNGFRRSLESNSTHFMTMIVYDF